MTYDWQTHIEATSPTVARFLPPAMVDETGWDILLVLYSECRRDLNVGKLASLVSAPEAVMIHWLATLERRELIAGRADPSTGEILAVLTPKGRVLLDRYFSATGDLQVGAHH